MKQLIKRCGGWIALVLCSYFVHAQPTLQRIEYYLDTDPGYGRAIAISFSPTATNISDATLNIDPTNLSPGVHILCLRARDANGQWSHNNKWIVAKPFTDETNPPPLVNLGRIEYYLDNDPGYGSAISIPFAAGTDLSDITVNIDPATLDDGIHILCLRARDVNGQWSENNRWLFAKPFADEISGPGISPDITDIEYYIDGDPGFGKGNPIAINKSANLPDFSLKVNVSGLNAGSHKLFIRSKDAKGSWSLDYKYGFSVSPAIPAPSIVVNGVTKKVLCAKDSLSVSYQAKGTFNVGNVFSVELSDSAGSFAAPIVIGTYTGIANTIVNAVLPSHLPTGNKYRVRVSSSNPVVAGITGADSLVIRDAPYAQTITGDGNVNSLASYPYSVPSVVGSSWAWVVPTGTVTPSANTASIVWNTAALAQVIKVAETNSFGCKGDTSTKLVNVYDLKIDSVKVSTLKPCPASAITVTAQVSGVYNAGNIFTAQLSNATGSFASPVSIGSVAANPIGSLQPVSISAIMPYPLANGAGYRIRVVSSSPALISADNGLSITVSKPNLGADKTASICPGTSINLNTLFTTTGLTSVWNTPRADSVTNAGNYRLIVTNANGCKDTAFVTVILYTKPTVGRDTTFSICAGTTTDIAAMYNTAGYSSVVWSTPNPQAVSGGIYTLIVTNANGCMDTAVITVNLFVKPSLGNDTTVTICIGDTRSIVSIYNITGFSNVEWSVPNPDKAEVGSYRLIVTDANGCRDTAFITVAGYPKPNLGADTTVTICEGAATDIRGLYNTTAFNSVQWNTSRPDSVHAGTYELYVVNENGCKDTAIITVSEMAPLNPVINPAGPVSICNGDSITLTVSGGPFIGYVWSNGKTSSSIVVKTTGSYSVTVTNNLGCQKTSAAVSVTKITDNVAPTITCPANIVDSVTGTNCTRFVLVPPPVYSDNCGVVSLTWVMTGATTGSSASTGIRLVGNRAYNIGKAFITYTAKDAAGKSSSCNFSVTIRDLIKPVFTSTNSNITQFLDSGCTKSIPIPDVTFSDNCSSPAITWSMSGATIASDSGQVGTQVFNTGQTKITYTITDASGNKRTAFFNVKLIDNIVPSITCPASITRAITGPDCSRSVTVADPVFSDNCGVKSLTWAMTGATTTVSASVGIKVLGSQIFNAGTTTVTYTITDPSGRTNNCSFNVIVTTTNTCGNIAAAKTVTESETTEYPEVRLFPNPTLSAFALQLKSNDKSAAEIIVYGSDGRKMEVLKAFPAKLLYFGKNYHQGVYLIEVRQGERKIIVKGVKQ